MPKIKVIYYREVDGAVPVLEFMEKSPERARVKIIARIMRLRELGHELRRPEADYLRDGIYELRSRLGHTNYRVLYFFHKNTAAILSTGLSKEDVIPPIEIERAKERKAKFEKAPATHTFEEFKA